MKNHAKKWEIAPKECMHCEKTGHVSYRVVYFAAGGAAWSGIVNHQRTRSLPLAHPASSSSIDHISHAHRTVKRCSNQSPKCTYRFTSRNWGEDPIRDISHTWVVGGCVPPPNARVFVQVSFMLPSLLLCSSFFLVRSMHALISVGGGKGVWMWFVIKYLTFGIVFIQAFDVFFLE